MNLLVDLLATLRPRIVAASLAIGSLGSFFAYLMASKADAQGAFVAIAFVVCFAVSLTVLQRREKK